MSHVQPWTTPSRALGCRFERSRFLEEKQGVPTSSFQIAPMRDVVFQGSVPGELKLGGGALTGRGNHLQSINHENRELVWKIESEAYGSCRNRESFGEEKL